MPVLVRLMLGEAQRCPQLEQRDLVARNRCRQTAGPLLLGLPAAWQKLAALVALTSSQQVPLSALVALLVLVLSLDRPL